MCTRLKKELVTASSQNGHSSLQGRLSQKPTSSQNGHSSLQGRLSQEPTSSQNGHSSQKGRLSQGISREGYTLDQEGLLRYKGRVVVPAQKALTQELLFLYHDDQLAGHWGVDKTKELLERKFYWPGLARDVREYVTTCSTCQNIATPRHKPYGKLESLPVPNGPWQEVSLNFIT